MATDPATLHQSARRAMSAGDFAGAQALLTQIVQIDGKNLAAWLGLAGVRRQLNDRDGAYQALREVLRIEPRHFHALLMIGSLLELEGHLRRAATSYGAALANVPPEQYLDAATKQAAAHAREVHERHTRELGQYIHDHLADARSQCTPAEQRRIDTFIGTTLRTRMRYQQEPSDYFYPGLPAIEFYEREEFPWLADFEAATPAIQHELVSILREDQRGFAPYIHYDDHLPLDQWRELNHSPRWTAFHFFDKGTRIEERCRRAPATMQALTLVPQPQVRLRSPTAMFSALQPQTRIPPHTGVANFRLVLHLPLIVPAGCGFRVGGDTRQWRSGEAWIFDDTIEHEAWNDSDQTRIVFICDVWNPRLSPEERITIDRIIGATDAFNGTNLSNQI
ncbi:aspartyl/asparaginyl beta-hydroxylase domain-containing protein [Povalibacter sp.]|uniref:aspartyl/asparaginyl beta-hydroxylase domain-containing protein n=1 Tax=Povalibacter sp. TaxID=1962978 RepID=UPI002F3EC4B4